MLTNPRFYSVVAEVDGRIVGSNFLDERNAIAGVGPITVDPTAQNRTIGRRLMDAVHERAAHKNFAGVRLIQAAFTPGRYPYMPSLAMMSVNIWRACKARRSGFLSKVTSLGRRLMLTSKTAIVCAGKYTALIVAEN
jgi:GNAT superfamily N-acetyltransferase